MAMRANCTSRKEPIRANSSAAAIISPTDLQATRRPGMTKWHATCRASFLLFIVRDELHVSSEWLALRQSPRMPRARTGSCRSPRSPAPSHRLLRTMTLTEHQFVVLVAESLALVNISRPVGIYGSPCLLRRTRNLVSRPAVDSGTLEKLRPRLTAGPIVCANLTRLCIRYIVRR